MTPQARRTWRNVAVLVLAQSVLGAQLSIQFIAGGLVGQTLSWTPCLATLPLSMMILGSTLSARPLAGFMARHGRRAGFMLASGVAATGAVLATLGLRYSSFGLFMAGTTLCGCYMAAQGFFRFAATDTAPPEIEPKAISLVLAGGLTLASCLFRGGFFAGSTFDSFLLGLFKVLKISAQSPGSFTNRIRLWL